LKERVKALLTERGLAFEDLGTNSEESVDFPPLAFAVAEKVAGERAAGSDALGILACGSGVGMDIAANKVKGARAALALTEYMGRQSREHDDANILVLAGRVIGEELAVKIAGEFLEARFGGEDRHARRVKQIEAYEAEHLS
jgi:ribose 5-phosphate isomerase B